VTKVILACKSFIIGLYFFQMFKKVYFTFSCSEKSISIDDIRELLPSRCAMGEEFCEGSCHAIGRRNGSCTPGEVIKHFKNNWVIFLFLTF
jgi:hypothetical protein